MGADGSAIRKLGLVPRTYLLTVGRLEPRKNHAGLLHAFSKLASPRPKLVIAGQRDFGYLEIFNLIDTLGLRDDVLVLEQVDDLTLPALYRSALAFVYPTWAEGFGMPVLEAMASGVPILTSESTALPEVAGDAAIYFHAGDTQAMSASIGKIVSDVDLRSKLIDRGLRRVADFDWERSASVLLRSYENYFGLNPSANSIHGGVNA